MDFYIVPRLEEMLYKTMQYAKSAYEEAISANEAAARTENTINEFINEYKTSGDGNNNNINCNDKVVKGYVKKKKSWYTVSIIMIVALTFF